MYISRSHALVCRYAECLKSPGIISNVCRYTLRGQLGQRQGDQIGRIFAKFSPNFRPVADVYSGAVT
jgi:hypothetical protein